MTNNLQKTIGLLFLLMLLLQACGEAEALEEAPTHTPILKTVSTQKVKSVNYQPAIIASGKITMDESISLSFKAGGQIRKIYAKQGQWVKKGQVLAVLNTNQVEVQADQANLAIDRVAISIQSASLLLERANTQYQNTLGLFQDSLATLEQLEQAKVNLDICENQLLTAQKEQQISAKTERGIQLALEDAQIIAPSDGMVIQKLVSENEMISGGMPALLFNPKQQAKIMKVHVIDKEVVQLNIGDTATLYFDAHPDNIFMGQVIEIAHITDPLFNTYEVKIGLHPCREKLFFGFIGQAKIKVGNRRAIKSIPINALLSADGKKGKVFTINNEKAIETAITIFKLEDEQLLVADGLQENQEVVISGIDHIHHQEKVIVNNAN